jgi:uncharacterized Zn-binding protein involved in type VI secretion
MGQPAAKQGDKVMATDTHILLVPAPPGSPTPVPLPHPFSGTLTGGLSQTVKIGGKPAAVVGSTATNTPSHIPANPAAQFQKQPANKGTVQKGSLTVKINGKAAARAGDTVMTCNDPTDLAAGTIVVTGGTVNIG